MWELTKEQRVVQENMAKRMNRKIVKQTEPVLNAGLGLYYTAFFALHSERQSAFGVGCIPWRAIKEYAVYYDFNVRQSEFLFRAIEAMDRKYIEYQNELQAKRSNVKSK